MSKKQLKAIERRVELQSSTQRPPAPGTSIYAVLPADLNPSNVTPLPMAPFVKGMLRGKQAADAIYREKVVDRTIHIEPNLPKGVRKRPNKGNKSFTSKEKKELKLFDVGASEEDCQFDLYVPLHELWMQYMTDVTMNANEQEIGLRILKADFHGANFKVVRSKNPPYVGVEGLVAQETAKTFKIVTRENQMKVIPKADNVFAFALNGRLFILHGTHFQARSAERVTKRFKNKSTFDF